MTGEVTKGQQEESTPTTCIPILLHFLRLHDCRCKLEYILLQLCLFHVILSVTENCLPTPFCLCLLVEVVVQ